MLLFILNKNCRLIRELNTVIIYIFKSSLRIVEDNNITMMRNKIKTVEKRIEELLVEVTMDFEKKNSTVALKNQEQKENEKKNLFD